VIDARSLLSLARLAASPAEIDPPFEPLPFGRPPPLSEPFWMAPARISRQLPYSSLSVGRLSRAFCSSDLE
jgi:hypothetical protein